MIQKNFQPITYLPVIYKILTSILGINNTEHLTNNDVIEMEQNGGRMRALARKEWILIDEALDKSRR